ncbi:MAG: hypothetical protein PVH17_10495 [Anaerolineae bacterium]|jgi:hypothetical protein
MKVAIRRISLVSLGKMGCLLGAVAAFLPSLLCGVASLGLADLLRRWLESWHDVPISMLGREVVRFDFVQLLGFENLLDALQILTSASGASLFLAVLALSLVNGALLAAIIALVGLAYNLLATATGGIVVEMAQVTTSQETGPRSDPSER